MIRYLRVFSYFLVILGCMALKGDNSSASAIAIDNNGKLVIAGTTQNSQTMANEFAITRLNTDGTPDITFNPLGAPLGSNSTTPLKGQVTLSIQGVNDTITSVAIDENNNIIVAGFSMNTESVSSYAVARFLENGTLDTTFNSGGQLPGGPGVALITINGTNDSATGVALDQLGRIVLVGTTDTVGTATTLSVTVIGVVRLTSAGNLDRTFGSSSTPGIFIFNLMGTDQLGSSIAIDAENNIYVGGSISVSSQNADFLLFKLTPRGALDPTFNTFSVNPGVFMENLRNTTGLVAEADRALAIGLDAENRIVMAGNSSTGSNETDFALLRVLPSGVLDVTFNATVPPPGVPGVVITPISGNLDSITALAFDPNQNIVVTGYTVVNQMGTGDQNDAFTTARYLPNGHLDPTFTSGVAGSTPGIVITNLVVPESFANNSNAGAGVAVSADNQIYVTGFSFNGSQVNFTTINYLPTGSLNTTVFDPIGTTPGVVYSMFGVELIPGNGVPIFVGGDTTGLGPQVLDELRYPPSLVIPTIDNADSLIFNDFAPFLSGTAAPEASLTLYANEIPVVSIYADKTGAWSAHMPPLIDGVYTISVLATDSLTNISLSSEPTHLTIATQLPPSPLIEVPAPHERLKTAQVFIRGRAQAHTTVNLYLNGEDLAQVRANAEGIWSFTTRPLEDNVYTLFAVSTDLAGNVSPPSDDRTFILDRGLQRVPRILSPTNTFVTNKSELMVRGEARPQSYVNLYLNTKLIGRIKVDDQGAWSYQLKGLKDGDYRLSASTPDKQLKSTLVNFSVNKTPPAAPQLTKTPDGFITGRAPAFSTIRLYIDDKLFGTTSADAKGSWAFNPSRDQKVPHGPHRIKAVVADKAGNISSFVEQVIML